MKEIVINRWENTTTNPPKESGEYKCYGVVKTQTGGLRTFTIEAYWHKEKGEWFDECGSFTAQQAKAEYWKLPFTSCQP